MLDGRRLSPLAIRRFDRAEIFTLAADDDDAPASQIGGLLGSVLLGTPATEWGTGRECEVCQRLK
jgi:hypothetical protein